MILTAIVENQCSAVLACWPSTFVAQLPFFRLDTDYHSLLIPPPYRTQRAFNVLVVLSNSTGAQHHKSDLIIWQSPHEGHVAIKTIAKFRQACCSPHPFLLNPHIPIARTHPQSLPFSLLETSSSRPHARFLHTHNFLYISCASIDLYPLFVFTFGPSSLYNPVDNTGGRGALSI